MTPLCRHIHAPRSAIYRALTDATAVQQWMVPDNMTSEVHAFDAREGGVFRISLTYTDGSSGKSAAHTDTFHGRFTRLVPDAMVEQAVVFETDKPEMQGEMQIRYDLADASDGTDVTAEFTNLPRGVREEDNTLGWRMSMDKLARLVER